MTVGWNTFTTITTHRIESKAAFIGALQIYVVCTSINPYSARIQENVDQKNSEYGHFSRIGKRYFFCAQKYINALSCIDVWQSHA